MPCVYRFAVYSHLQVGCHRLCAKRAAAGTCSGMQAKAGLISRKANSNASDYEEAFNLVLEDSGR